MTAPAVETVFREHTEGHRATSRADLVRDGLCAAAIRPGRLLGTVIPGRAGGHRPLAIPLPTHGRRPARTDADGELVLLTDQDRALWVEPLDLPRHQLLRAVRADLLRRLGRDGEAAAAYAAAIAQRANEAERTFLERRRAALDDGTTGNCRRGPAPSPP